MLMSRLSGPDLGPKSQYTQSNWDKKIISSSGNKIMVEFRSDHFLEQTGFSASIIFTTQFQSKMCESSLDLDNKTFLSPNYPNFYDDITSCDWLITVKHGHHIELKFHEFDVSIF